MGEIAGRFRPDVVRFYLLSTHYRTEIEFSDERLAEAAAAVERFENVFRTLARLVGPEGEGPAADPSEAISDARARFMDAMDDDLNTAQAIGVLFEIVRVINQEIESGRPAPVLRAGRAVLRELSDILGLLRDVGAKEDEIPAEIQELARRREEAREARDWATADALRGKIEGGGYRVEDTSDGPVVRKAGQ
jgi:cysteinyl-tRNA synthetase